MLHHCTRRLSIFNVGLVAATLLATGAADGAERVKVAIINADQAGVPSTASGCAYMVINTVANTLDYRMAYSGLSSAETVAHLHGPAAIGGGAPPVHTLPPGNPKVGVWNYPEVMEADILAGRIYINIHSAMFGGGEIRGQLSDMVAVIDGAQAGAATPAGGYGLFNIDTDSDEVTYYISFGGLLSAETVAHIHGFSLHAAGSPPQHTLPAGTLKTGTWTYPAGDEQKILDGLTYVNIHSMGFPGGEIRGQVSRNIVPIDGRQETPPVVTSGAGSGVFSVDRPNDTLSYYVAHANLTGPATAAHIHGFAGPGGMAPPQHTISTTSPAIGSWTYAAADEAAILGGQTYVNIHTAAHGGGEIRGQVQYPALPCPADIDCSGDTGFTDLLQVLAAWGPCPGCAQDLDGDGNVGFTDLLTVLAAWGPCP